MSLKERIHRGFLKKSGAHCKIGAAGGEKSLFPIITASGAAAAVVQIVLLRELMVLFYGIELGLGLVLTVWLLGSATGCVLSVKFIGRKQRKEIIPTLSIAVALLLPTILLIVRASSLLWSITTGDIPPLNRMILICLVTTFPCSFLSGALFNLCWFFSDKAGTSPMGIYSGEALGATAGGIGFYLLVMSRLPALAILLIMSLVLLSAIIWTFSRGTATEVWKIRLPTYICAAAVTVALLFHQPIDHASRRWQWGPDFLAAEDTPYQNLVVVQRDRQLSIFANGLWRFSAPDRQSVEWAVHPALLQHPDPQSVLILGGVPQGLPEEILRHPSVQNVTAVELDPALVDLAATYPFKGDAVSSTETKIRLQYQDAAVFLRTGLERYDVILTSMEDPVNAQLNRFYTTSFFQAVKGCLAPSGIFSFDVSGGEDMLGEVQIAFLGTVFRTLGRSFSTVSVLPGDQVRFFATGEDTPLINDPRMLSERIRARGLDLSHVREDTLQDRFETFRMRYFSAVLQDTSPDLVNTDFTPLCYAHALRLWAHQWHPLLGKAVQWLTQIPPMRLWLFFLSACVLFLGVFRIAGLKSTRVVCLNVAVVGGACMVIQMVLLIVFQILEGALFLHLALIVALFMAGLAAGAAWMSLKTRRARKEIGVGKLLIRIQTLFCILPCALAGLFLMLHGPLRGAGGNLTMLMFPGLSFVSGMIEGMHFAAAAAVMAELGKPVSGVGGRLYAFDLLGSAGGLIAATFLLVPVFGPLQLLPMLSIAALTSLGLLIAGLRKG